MSDTPIDGDIPFGSAVIEPARIEGKFLCTVPAELGPVTRLKVVGDRVVAETASGVPMIVPTSRPAT